jgi:hypothetical protein
MKLREDVYFGILGLLALVVVFGSLVWMTGLESRLTRVDRCVCCERSTYVDLGAAADEAEQRMGEDR